MAFASGSRTSVPRPVLFALVYGIFLVIVGVTATAQTMMVSTNFTSSTMQSVVGTDAALVRSVVNTYVQQGDLDPAGPSAARRTELEADFASLVRRAEILRVELRRPDGTVIVGDRSDVSGLPASASDDFRTAAEGGTISAGIANVDESEAVGPALSTSSVLREYFPLQAGGRVQAVVGVWRDAVPILAELDRLRRDVVVTTLIAGTRRRLDPVPGLPLRTGSDHPGDRRPRRCDPTRPADRPAQPRRARRRAGPRRRRRTDGRPADRHRAHRYRRVPAAQRDLRARRGRSRPPGRRRGPPHGASGRDRPMAATGPTSSSSSPLPTRSRTCEPIARTRAIATRRLRPSSSTHPSACRSPSARGSVPTRSTAIR